MYATLSHFWMRMSLMSILNACVSKCLVISIPKIHMQKDSLCLFRCEAKHSWDTQAYWSSGPLVWDEMLYIVGQADTSDRPSIHSVCYIEWPRIQDDKHWLVEDINSGCANARMYCRNIIHTYTHRYVGSQPQSLWNAYEFSRLLAAFVHCEIEEEQINPTQCLCRVVIKIIQPFWASCLGLVRLHYH